MSRILQLNGFFVVTCRDGETALNLFPQIQPSLAILDIRMPGLDGLALCARLRAASDVPVIILTATEDEATAAEALEAGADDYVRKPFGAAEFIARVRAVLRRADVDMPPTVRYECGPLVIDERQRLVTLHGREIALSRTEFGLLAYLARNANRVLTHDQILERVWGRSTSAPTTCCASLSRACARRSRRRVLR